MALIVMTSSYFAVDYCVVDRETTFFGFSNGSISLGEDGRKEKSVSF